VTGPASGHRSSSEYERLLAENQRYTETFDRSALTAAPLSGLVILACMDARLDVEEALGLRTGDAHIIRNAGGLATDDAIRSIAVSQHVLGTDEIVVIEHTGCGLHGADPAVLRERIAHAVGADPATVAPGLEFGEFADLEANLRAQVERLRGHPLLRPVPIHGLIFDVATGRLHEIA
jgi:carbonic anhydrase